MAITQELREFVRQRAHFACEYCGVREIDAGNHLTVDHFRPVAKDGDDSLGNLVYCCIHCNQYKRDYWPTLSAHPHLWNPRIEPASTHLLLVEDGVLQALTSTGRFTIHLLHLNRSALVAYRQNRQQEAIQVATLTQLRELTQVYDQLLGQQMQLITQQRQLIEAQQLLLRQLLGSIPYLP
jgi:hypothetical protein